MLRVPVQEIARLEQLTASSDFMPLLEEYAKDLADPKVRFGYAAEVTLPAYPR